MIIMITTGGVVYIVPAPSTVFFPETEVPLQVARQQRSSQARSCDTCRLWFKANVSSGRARVGWVGCVLPSSLVHSKHYGGRGFPVLEWRRAGQQRRIPSRGEQQRPRRAERQRQRGGRAGAGPGHLRVQHLFGHCQGRCHQYVRPLVLVRDEAGRCGGWISCVGTVVVSAQPNEPECSFVAVCEASFPRQFELFHGGITPNGPAAVGCPCRRPRWLSGCYCRGWCYK